MIPVINPEITKKLEDLVNYWFTYRDIWFGCGPEIDKYLTDKYINLLTIDPFVNNHNTETIKTPINNKTHYLGIIILWDQITRHVYRHLSTQNNLKQIEMEQIEMKQIEMKQIEMEQIEMEQIEMKKYNKNSLTLALSLLEYDRYYSPEERCFLLMPLRHTFNEHYLEIVIEKIKEYIELEGIDNYKRFFKNTLISYSNIITKKIIPDMDHNTNISHQDILSILDKRAITNSTITNPTTTNPTTTTNNLNPELMKNKLYKKFIPVVKKNSNSGLIISISGGVDSMICSYILANLKRKYPNFNLIAMMVNYNNRSETELETEFVKRWCLGLNIPLYIRHIKHIKRCNTDRNFYEKITKRFRFDLYKKFNYSVILGHNKDDSIENIFTNIRKGRNYDNLRGMYNSTTVDGVVFYRPLLDITKQEIYKFAQLYKIPFLYDSTPSWSDRGKMRDALIPFLNTFDPGLIPNLLKLSDHISALNKTQQLLVNEFIKNISYNFSDKTILITLPVNTTYTELGFNFWKEVLRIICNTINTKIFSNKSIYNFTSKLEQKSYGKISLCLDIHVVYYQKNKDECLCINY